MSPFSGCRYTVTADSLFPFIGRHSCLPLIWWPFSDLSIHRAYAWFMADIARGIFLPCMAAISLPDVRAAAFTTTSTAPGGTT